MTEVRHEVGHRVGQWRQGRAQHGSPTLLTLTNNRVQ